MLDVLRAKKDLLIAELKKAEFSVEDENRINEEVAKFKDELIAKVRAEKGDNASRIKAKLEVIDELIAEELAKPEEVVVPEAPVVEEPVGEAPVGEAHPILEEDVEIHNQI